MTRRLILRPSPRLVLLLVVAAFPALFAGSSALLRGLWVLCDLVLLALVLVEVRSLRALRGLECCRVLPLQVRREAPFETILYVLNPTGRPLDLRLIDRWPAAFEPRERTVPLRVAPHGEVALPQSQRALRRGEHALVPLVAECRSPLGLLAATLITDGPRPLAVLPSLELLGRFDALLRQRHLHEMGVGRVRERGEGTEIVGLRHYASGDAFGRIDWKVTARRGVPIVRELTAERRQTVLLLLDCGRRMAREHGGLSRLDHAIEAALLLTHVALRADDRVALMAFADRPLRTVLPLRGPQHAAVIAQAVVALQPVLREPPYAAILAQAMRRFPRRSLAVLFSDAVEPAALQALTRPLALVARRHLLLCVVFRDPAIDAAAGRPLADRQAFFGAGAAAELALERELALAALQRAGAIVIEATGPELSTAVINAYLRIKAQRLL